MAKAKVLLASSTKIGLELMRRYLKDLDLWVLTAEDGPSLLKMAQRHRPHLIYMDVELTAKSGVECCWQLRNSEHGRTIPIVLITTGHAWDTDACLAAGCSEVLSKPLNQPLFVSLGHKLLGSFERREVRSCCRAVVQCRCRIDNFYGTMEDIGRHGMFVGSSQRMKIGDIVRLRFLLPWPQAEPFSTEATVAWINRGPQRQRSYLPDGFGVVFNNPSPALTAHVELFVEYSFLLLNPEP